MKHQAKLALLVTILLICTAVSTGQDKVAKPIGPAVESKPADNKPSPTQTVADGKEITNAKGGKIGAYIYADTPLDLIRSSVSIVADMAPSADVKPPLAAFEEPALFSVKIKSTPDADITLDGRFVGNSPSQQLLARGEYVIAIEKKGFQRWERTLAVGSSTDVTINATLERLP